MVYWPCRLVTGISGRGVPRAGGSPAAAVSAQGDQVAELTAITTSYTRGERSSRQAPGACAPPSRTPRAIAGSQFAVILTADGVRSTGCPPGDFGSRYMCAMKVAAMPGEVPSGLRYVLTAGREEELVLRVHGAAPTSDELVSWMREGTVRVLTVSRRSDEETSTLVPNFARRRCPDRTPQRDPEQFLLTDC